MEEREIMKAAIEIIQGRHGSGREVRQLSMVNKYGDQGYELAHKGQQKANEIYAQNGGDASKVNEYLLKEHKDLVDEINAEYEKPANQPAQEAKVEVKKPVEKAEPVIENADTGTKDVAYLESVQEKAAEPVKAEEKIESRTEPVKDKPVSAEKPGPKAQEFVESKTNTKGQDPSKIINKEGQGFKQPKQTYDYKKLRQILGDKENTCNAIINDNATILKPGTDQAISQQEAKGTLDKITRLKECLKDFNGQDALNLMKELGTKTPTGAILKFASKELGINTNEIVKSDGMLDRVQNAAKEMISDVSKDKSMAADEKKEITKHLQESAVTPPELQNIEPMIDNIKNLLDQFKEQMGALLQIAGGAGLGGVLLKEVMGSADNITKSLDTLENFDNGLVKGVKDSVKEFSDKTEAIKGAIEDKSSDVAKQLVSGAKDAVSEIKNDAIENVKNINAGALLVKNSAVNSMKGILETIKDKTSIGLTTAYATTILKKSYQNANKHLATLIKHEARALDKVCQQQKKMTQKLEKYLLKAEKMQGLSLNPFKNKSIEKKIQNISSEIETLNKAIATGRQNLSNNIAASKSIIDNQISKLNEITNKRNEVGLGISKSLEKAKDALLNSKQNSLVKATLDKAEGMEL